MNLPGLSETTPPNDAPSIDAETLPEGWARTDLRSVVAGIQTGFACGEHSRDSRGVVHVRPMNVSTTGSMDFGNVKYVPADVVSRDERRLISGDVVFNNTNSPELVGKTALFVGEETPAFSNHMTRVRCAGSILAQFAASCIHQQWRTGYFAAKCNNHVSQASISRDVLLDTPLLLPPLAEQTRIVEAVEACLARVDAARERLARVPAVLKRFRQSVLASACSGRLTADWRDAQTASGAGAGLESAAVTLERIRAERRAKDGNRYKEPAAPDTADLPELPESWTWTTAEQLAFVATGATPLRKNAEYFGGQIPWVTSSAVNAPLIVQADEYITQKALSETNAKVFPVGTLLIAMYGEGQTRGRVSELGIEAATNQAVAALIFDEEGGKTKPFAKLFLLKNYQDLRKLAAGGVQPNLSLSLIREMRVPFPPLAEQTEIVQRVNALFALSDRIEARVRAATVRTQAVTQAVLTKAFRGELVETEAAQARRENRPFETATELLTRTAKNIPASLPGRRKRSE